VLLQGGLHPHYGIEFYEDLFRKLKQRFPAVKIHALGPPEIAHISNLSGLTYRQVLVRLRDAGLESLPGAGAEILSDRVRKMLSPGKPDVKAWIDVMQEAHQLGFLTSATMMFGHVETILERIQHLEIIRSIQDRKPADAPGFMSFIPWPVTLDAKLKQQAVFAHVQEVSAAEYVRMIAISRLFLDNVPNIQASWLTVGKEVAQVCLHAGANDLGSIMIEENVLSSAGGTNRMDAQGMQDCIREAGFEPWLRDQAFNSRTLA
jgi:cyclic dehypoxanthinyl futalosine synthase